MEPRRNERPPFRKFPKIPNIDSREARDIMVKHADGEWVAAEKIHGANLSLVTNGVSLWCAKRSGYLGGDEALRQFFHADRILDTNRDAVLRLFTMVHALHPDTTHIRVYGELFGGHYPGTKNLLVDGKPLKPVQKEVWYCPDMAFAPFALHVTPSRTIHTQRVLFEAAAFPILPPEVFRGSLNALKALDINAGRTRIPTELKLEGEPLPWEGIVCHPVGAAGSRIKWKTQAFAEVKPNNKTQPTRSQRSRPSSSSSSSSSAPKMATTTIAAVLRERYINANRVNAVRSQHGPDLHPHHLANLVIRDALEDAIANQEVPSETMSRKKTVKAVVEALQKMVLTCLSQ